MDQWIKYLIVVIVSMEERFFAKDHACQHTA